MRVAYVINYHSRKKRGSFIIESKKGLHKIFTNHNSGLWLKQISSLCKHTLSLYYITSNIQWSKKLRRRLLGFGQVQTEIPELLGEFRILSMFACFTQVAVCKILTTDALNLWVQGDIACSCSSLWDVLQETVEHTIEKSCTYQPT